MSGRNEPPPEVVERAMQVMAEELNRQYPHLHFVPVRAGDPLRPGVRRISAAEVFLGRPVGEEPE